MLFRSVFQKSITETAAITQTQTVGTYYAVSRSETAAIDNSQSVALTLLAICNETATISEQQAAITNYRVSRTETAAITETQESAGGQLWIPIDTTQSPDWTIIET